MVDKGLIIKEHWLNKICLREKDWEIRGSRVNLKKLPSRIMLLESGSHRVRAYARISNCIELKEELWYSNKARHHVDMTWGELLQRYPKPYAWVLEDVDVIEGNFKYKHPKGAVIWVTNVEIEGEC